MAIETFNPATGEKLCSYPEHTSAQCRAMVDETAKAGIGWRRTRIEERAQVIRAAATKLRSRKTDLARLMALEMGKPLSQGEAEIEKCAWACDYFAAETVHFLAPRRLEPEAESRSSIVFEPLGVILAIMPWNFPFWQVFRAAVPALMAGNSMLLKHASNVAGCALAIAEVFQQAGLPKEVFQAVLIGSKQVSELIAHPAIAGVTLTGSTEAGKAVAAQAGGLLKKTVLELGGSDPYIILEDAALEKAAKICAESRLLNAGQSCIAAKRFIVVRSVFEKFQQAFLECMRATTVGDPLTAGVTMGPLARPDLRETLQRQVDSSVAAGAEILLGGEIPAGGGAFYPPTIVTKVGTQMAVFQEETFGPVAAIIEAADERDAIALANDTVFGLGAAIFTGDVERGERIAAEQLEAGSCFVNDFVKSDPRLPFGGIKQSGYGRELSNFGVYEFVNIKTVRVRA